MNIPSEVGDEKIKPRSCDTFAVLPPGTLHDTVVFGKNSDRPSDEVQEVVYYPASDHPADSKLKCTYIEIDQVPHTYSVILSKPSWMWGAEMGANEHNVCIGNEAVWTYLNDATDSDEKLLGMDLLRLGLERSKSAIEAVHVIVDLIDKYGMGGNCSDTLPDFTYHNSFLIADPSEVWILECAGKIWAAERVVEGVRNISNELSIGAKIDLGKEGLQKIAEDKGLWTARSRPFSFKEAFSVDDCDSARYKAGKRLLTHLSKHNSFSEKQMFVVLRDKPSGICMSSGSFVSTGSQVSVLRKPESGLPSCHWFTATPDPDMSVFKPFIFAEKTDFPTEVISSASDYEHKLFKKHQEFRKGQKKTSGSHRAMIRELEGLYVKKVEQIVENYKVKKLNVGGIFKEAVSEELTLYS